MWFIASVDPIAFLLTGQLHHLWSRGDPRLLLKNLQNKYLMRKDELLGSGKIGKRREEPESLKISHFWLRDKSLTTVIYFLFMYPR